MAFTHGADAKFLYHTMDMSPYLEGVDPTISRDTAEHKPLGSNPIRHAQGHMKMVLALTGIYDSAEDGEAETAWAQFEDGLAHVFTHLPQGDTFGAACYSGVADLGSEQVTVGDDIVKFPLSVVGSTEFDRCVVLAPLATQTASGSGSTHDNTQDTTNGGAAYLHVTDIEQGATLTVKLEHSTDGSTWDDLAVFTAATALTSERKTFSGTVRRYARATWTLAGGDAAFFVDYGRR